jgi:predicted sugar kinase
MCCALSALWGERKVSGCGVFSVKHGGFLLGGEKLLKASEGKYKY